MKEACGVFGVYAPGRDVAHLTYDGIYALQHRGQESAGMAVSDGQTITVVKDMGLVTAVFDERTLSGLSGLSGHLAIGHTRYSTHGSSDWMAAQPVYRESGRAGFALGHNGNLTNTAALADRAGMLPGMVGTDSDVVAELVGQAYAHDAGPDALTGALAAVLPEVEGAYSLVLMDDTRIYGVRDPHGFRPLCLGRLGPAAAPEGWVLASESPALDVVGATFVRELDPGELLVAGPDGVRSVRYVAPERVTPHLCIFEFVYFARPDATLYGREVHGARRRMGELLAEQAPVEADMVMGVPDSGVPAAEGYALRSGIPYGQGLVKNRYIARTFIDPDPEARRGTVRRKLNPLRENIAGKRLVVVDDSIVRSTTARAVVAMLRDAGATEVHLRISSPPFKWPCFFGIDTPELAELMAANHSLAEIERHLGADSLAYISLENLEAAIDVPGRGFCEACLTGHYPAPVPVSLRGLNGATVAVGPGATAERPVEAALQAAFPGVWSAAVAGAGGGATYAGAGVDIAAGEAAVERLKSVVAATGRPGVLGSIGGFGGLFALDTARYHRPVLVAATDGVGTKLSVARTTGRYDTVGIDLVAMCVDDLVCTGAEPLFLLDYVAVGKVVPQRVAEVVAGVAEGCRQAGCALLGGETAEHPGVMADDDLDLAGFAVGAVDHDAVLGPERVGAGNVLVGLMSPGLRSNGYTLARHVLLERAGLDLEGPAWPGAGHTLADELLRPSVIYARAVLAALAAGGVRAGAHITGGGIAGNLARVLPPGCDARLERRAWEVPAVFGEIARLGPVEPAEMERVFNLGLGFVLVVEAGSADAVVRALATAGCEARVVGDVVAGEGRVVMG